MVETMWYLGRSALGGADDERLTRESSLCKEQAQASDPCPFPPFSYQPGFFGELVLFFLFFGYRDFGVEAILLPPTVDAATSNNQDLQGSVASRVAITGTGLLGKGRQVLATAGVDVILSTGLPQYDATTGRFSNVEITRIDAVDLALDYDGRFPIFWIFTSIAQSIITGLAVTAANNFIDAANREIDAFLQRTPLLQIPTLRKFPTARTDVQLTLANVVFAGVPADGSDNTDGFLSLDAGVDLVVRPRADAPPALLVPTAGKSRSDIAPTVYREAYEACATPQTTDDPDIGSVVVTRSYSSFDGTTSVLYTCRFSNGQVEVLDTDRGTWSVAVAP
jgi:hypothetical protein